MIKVCYNLLLEHGALGAELRIAVAQLRVGGERVLRLLAAGLALLLRVLLQKCSE